MDRLIYDIKKKHKLKNKKDDHFNDIHNTIIYTELKVSEVYTNLKKTISKIESRPHLIFLYYAR